jgi:hypothetical protein
MPRQAVADIHVKRSRRNRDSPLRRFLGLFASTELAERRRASDSCSENQEIAGFLFFNARREIGRAELGVPARYIEKNTRFQLLLVARHRNCSQGRTPSLETPKPASGGP